MHIDKSVTVRGSFQVEGDLVLEGTLEGRVFVTGRLEVGRTGVLIGEANCSGGRLLGKLSGILSSDEPVDVDAAAVVSGRVAAPALDFVRRTEAAPREAAPPRGATARPFAGRSDDEAGGRPAARGAAPPPPTVTGDRSKVVVDPSAVLEETP